MQETVMCKREIRKNSLEKRTGVSVILPVHREPIKIVKAAVDSIFRQTISIKELIICEDGSSGTVLRKYLNHLEKERRIVLIRNKTAKGAANARNRAMERATGEYIALMDADDISAPCRLQRERELLENHPELSFAGCKGAYFEKKTGDIQRNYWYVEKPEPKDFFMTLPYVHGSMMFRREVLEAVDGYREVGWVKRSEDYDLLLRLYAAGYRGANLPEVLYEIRLDQTTLHRRKYRYRFCEALVKLVGFARLGLLPKGILFAMKPLVIGLLPKQWVEWGKRRYYGRN